MDRSKDNVIPGFSLEQLNILKQQFNEQIVIQVIKNWILQKNINVVENEKEDDIEYHKRAKKIIEEWAKKNDLLEQFNSETEDIFHEKECKITFGLIDDLKRRYKKKIIELINVYNKLKAC